MNAFGLNTYWEFDWRWRS